MEFIETYKTIHMDDILKKDLNELKNHIEENELLHGINVNFSNFFYMPKDPSYYKKYRHYKMNQILSGKLKNRLKIISDDLESEIETCEKSDYREKSLPLLIRENYKVKLDELVNMKKSLMVRYKRYCITEDMKTNINFDYNFLLNQIMDSYRYYSSRISKLKFCKEALICKTDIGIEEITPEDCFDYSRYLVAHFYQIRYLNNIMRLIKWIPQKYRKKGYSKKGNDSESTKSDKSVIFGSSVSITVTNEKDLVVAPRHYSITQTDSNIPSRISQAEGGKLAVDEKHLLLPLHTNNINIFMHLLKYLCQTYEIGMDISTIKSSADEMELFSMVNRRFKGIFNAQEQMKSFKIYEKSIASDKWGKDNCNHSLLKPATWLNDIYYYPTTRLLEVNYLKKLESKNYIDEELVSASYFVKMETSEDVQNNLRHYALIIQHMPVAHTTAVISNPIGFSLSDIFKMVYGQHEINDNSFTKVSETYKYMDDIKKYSFTETMQSLGLDEATETNDGGSTAQGAFLSYLHLRILKIRDLQRTCLSILNYFRSVERTLTIDKFGYPLKPTIENDTPDNFIGIKGENIGYHKHVFNTVNDFKIPKETFMKFMEIENYEDFYFHIDGRMHIRDQKGYWIMYDIALKDLEKLDKELVLIGSYYINVDKDLRYKSLFKRKKSENETNNSDNVPITEIGHREIDRFGVLYDLWTHHTSYLETKMQIVEMYMEIYHSILRSPDRAQIAQKIIDIIHRKPRLDLNAPNFVYCYRLEMVILKRLFDIYREIFSKDHTRSREYYIKESTQSVYHIIPKMPVSLHTNKPLLITSYFFEFCNSLGMASDVHDVIDITLQTIFSQGNIGKSVTSLLINELDALDYMIQQINQLSHFEETYNEFVRENIFSSDIMDSTIKMNQIAHEYMTNIENRNVRGDKKSRKIRQINEYGKLLDFITARFRLIDALSECEILNSIYNNQAHILGYDSSAAFACLIPFETARHKELAESTKPLQYISSIQDDDNMIVKISVDKLGLAIHELDKIHIGDISLKSKEDIVKVLETKKFDHFKDMLKLQLLHKSALCVGVFLCDSCKPTLFSMKNEEEKISWDEGMTDVENMKTTSLSIAAQPGPTPLALDKFRLDKYLSNDVYPEAFFPIQYEKHLCRDKMFNFFIRKTANAKLSEVSAMEKAKRESITFFIENMLHKIHVAGLRAQIVAYYASIINMLQQVPDITKEFFDFGVTMEFTKFGVKDVVVDNNFRGLRNRKRKVISKDGDTLINIWYIPHFTEIIFLFRNIDESVSKPIFKKFLKLVIGFHDILQYLFGYYKCDIKKSRLSEFTLHEVLNNANINFHPRTPEYVHKYHTEFDNKIPFYNDYNNSCSYHLKKELIDIQQQIDYLPQPPKLDDVIELLFIRRRMEFCYFDTILNSFLSEVVSATGDPELIKKNKIALQSTINCVKQLKEKDKLMNGIGVPSFMNCLSKNITELYPWRSLYLNKGPFLNSFETWININELIELNLEIYPNKFRNTIQDTFINLTVTLYDVILEHLLIHDSSLIKPKDDRISFISTRFVKTKKDCLLKGDKSKTDLDKSMSKETMTDMINSENIDKKKKQFFSIRENAVIIYKLTMVFLKTWKSLNYYKNKLCDYMGHSNNSPENISYKEKTIWFRYKFLLPFLRKLSIDDNRPYLYLMGPISGEELITYPQGLSLKTIFERMLYSILEVIQINEINNLRCEITKQIDKIVKERNVGEFGDPSKSNYYKILKDEYLKNNIQVDTTMNLDISEKVEIDAAIEQTTIATPELTEVTGASMSRNLNENEQEKSNIIEHSDDNSKNVKNENDSNDNNQNNKTSVMAVRNYVVTEEVHIHYKTMNDTLQTLCNTIMRRNKEEYEMYAMYFENHLKHQQLLFKRLNKEIEELKFLLDYKEQAASIARKFKLAQCIHSIVKEINYLRAKIKQFSIDDERKEADIRKELMLEYQQIVRNLHSLGIDSIIHIMVGKNRFQAEVYSRISEIRLKAANEMKRIKEKSGTKFTLNDELAFRNIELSDEIRKKRNANIEVKSMFLQMKTLFNWKFNYAKNIQSYQICINRFDLSKYLNMIEIRKIDMEQDVKLHKIEFKLLEEALKYSDNKMEELRNLIHQERQLKIQATKAAKLRQAKIKQDLKNKSDKINELSRESQRLNGMFNTMKIQYESHLATRQSVVTKSHKEVEKLSQLLHKQRHDKMAAFNKVDQLIAQVADFENTYAIVQRKHYERPHHVSTIEELSRPLRKLPKPGTVNLEVGWPKPRQTEFQKLTYKAVKNRYNIPYAPNHFIPFRRDRLTFQKLRNKIKQKLTRGSSRNSPSLHMINLMTKLSKRER